MLTVEQALDRILAGVEPLGVEVAGLHEAHGRVLARDVVSAVDVPPWDNSGMDGYAVRAADTADGEVTLRLNEVIAAGGVGTVRVEAGTASAIMTGAPMPDGADAVVMVERSDGSRSGVVRLQGAARPGQHVRRRGLDVARGDVVLRAGTRLGGAALGMAASVGCGELPVWRRPTVAVLSTGDEVVLPGTPLGPGQIWSSNNFALCALVRDAGAVAVDHGNCVDDPAALSAALLAAARGADAVCTTGGVSMGAFDHVRQVHADLGAEVDFWKVRMKPGKPLAYGRLRVDGRVVPLFGLPGNPVSCLVNFLEFARPWIRKVQGDLRPFLPVVDAIAAEDFPERSDRARFERVVLEVGAHGWTARSTGSQSSAVLTSMVRANGFLLVGADAAPIRVGDRVRVQLLDAGFLDGAEPGFGW